MVIFILTLEVFGKREFSLLCKLYTDNIIKTLSEVNAGCCLGPFRVNITAYADIVIQGDTKENTELLCNVLQR